MNKKIIDIINRNYNFNFENWKYNIDLNSAQYNDEFYYKMFNAKDTDELKDILKEYYFISEPFENLYSSLHIDLHIDILRALKNLVLTSTAFAFIYSLRNGLDLTTALNILLYFNIQVENATTRKEVLQLRTDFLIEYYNAVRASKLESDTTLITHIKTYINHNINDTIYISEIAKKLGYNKEYISHQFKMITGQSIVSYINEKKTTLAKDLLLNTTDKIYDISSYLGFGSVSSFIRVFKNNTGLTPSQFRKNRSVGY